MAEEVKRGTGALMFRMPETVSWNLEIGGEDMAGDTLAEFLEAYSRMQPGTGATLSLTCLVEIEGK